MMTYHVQFLLLVLAGWVNRQQQNVIDYLQEENRVLRAGLRGKRLKLSDDDRRRLAVKAQALGREALAQIASVATPATLLRWYRHLIAANYDGSKNRSPGRPPTAKDIRELIVRVARENPTWGYTRLRGALKNLGHELGRNTIKRVLAEHGIAPAPERGKSMLGSRLNVAQLCGLAQGVEERGDFGSALRATAVVILAPNDGSPQGTFGRVIVGVHERVFDEQRQLRPALQHVSDRLAEVASRQSPLGQCPFADQPGAVPVQYFCADTIAAHKQVQVAAQRVTTQFLQHQR